MDYRIWNWNIDFLAVEESQISVSFLEQAGRAWMPVYVWTVDNYDKMSNYLDMGVSGLITNYPDLAREEIDDLHAALSAILSIPGQGISDLRMGNGITGKASLTKKYRRKKFI